MLAGEKSIGVSALQDHIYALEVYSEELDEDYSTDYEAYKRADDKLYVSTDADITGTDNDAIAESIYAYLAQFHDSGLKYYFEVRKKGGKGKIIKEQKEGDEVTVQDIKQVLDSL